MLDRPDSHLLQQLDELYGYRFGRYRQICDPASHSDRHRVLMVNAITICSLRTVIVLSCIPCKYSTICQNRQVKVHCGMLNGRDQAKMLKGPDLMRISLITVHITMFQAAAAAAAATGTMTTPHPTVARYVCFCCLLPARRLSCGGQKQEAGGKKKHALVTEDRNRRLAEKKNTHW